MPLELSWCDGTAAQPFRAAAAVAHGAVLPDEALAAPLRRWIEDLNELMVCWGLLPEPLWYHLVPLSAEVVQPRVLAELVLRKTLGYAAAASRADLLAVVLGAIPRAVAGRASAAAWGADMQAWRDRCAAHLGRLLADAGRWSDPEAIPQAAQIVLCPRLLDSGEAWCAYNRVTWEHGEQQEDRPAALPDLVRLAWLVAQLNVDVPRFAERIRHRPVPSCGALAMLPPVLQAAAMQDLAVCDRDTLAQALGAWRPALGPCAAGHSAAHEEVDVVWDWWQTQRAGQFPWPVALEALDRMLASPDRWSAAEEPAHPGATP